MRVYVRELHVRYRLRRMPGRDELPVRLHVPGDAACYLTPPLRPESVEVCGLLCLSARYDVLAYHELSRGTLDATVVHPRDVFRTALLANAKAVLVGTTILPAIPRPAPKTSCSPVD
jgi:DNA repair protein RadC